MVRKYHKALDTTYYLVGIVLVISSVYSIHSAKDDIDLFIGWMWLVLGVVIVILRSRIFYHTNFRRKR